MTYDVIMSDKASRALAGMPWEVVNEVTHELNRLSKNPVGLSTKPHPDYLDANYPYPRGQMYEIEWQTLSHFHIVTILFCYAQNEKDIFIIGIVHASMPL
jgi:hypothetical protein